MARPCPTARESLFDNREEGPRKALNGIQPSPNNFIRAALQRPIHHSASPQSPARVKMEPLKPYTHALATPVTYAIVAFLNREEDVDVFDEGTNFNPFVMDA